jgi:hypothetical protein
MRDRPGSRRVLAIPRVGFLTVSAVRAPRDAVRPKGRCNDTLLLVGDLPAAVYEFGVGTELTVLNDFLSSVIEQLLDRHSIAATPASRQAITAFLSYLVSAECDPDGYVQCSLRGDAKTLSLSVGSLRYARQCAQARGWIEQRPASPNRARCYRLTDTALLEIGRGSPELRRDLRNRVNRALIQSRGALSIGSDLSASHSLSIMREVSFHFLLSRLVDLNRARREMYQRSYNRTTLRNIAKLLFWFIRAFVESQGEWTIVSVRQMAKENGLVFRVTRHARDHLLEWSVLTQDGDAYLLQSDCLIEILGAQGELPMPRLCTQARRQMGTTRVLR